VRALVVVLVPAHHEIHPVLVEQRYPLLPDARSAPLNLSAVEITTWCMQTTIQSMSGLARLVRSSFSSQRRWAPPE